MFRGFRAKFHDDWCSGCTQVMEVERKQLYAMPDQFVGHYVSHDDPDYYMTNLIPVHRKSEIPTGTYACGLILYRCPYCGHTAVKVCVFLPVRDVEKAEQYLYFEHGELDDFVRQSAADAPEPPASHAPGTLDGEQVIRTHY